jgi:hypothetical protein
LLERNLFISFDERAKINFIGAKKKFNNDYVVFSLKDFTSCAPRTTPIHSAFIMATWWISVTDSPRWTTILGIVISFIIHC